MADTASGAGPVLGLFAAERQADAAMSELRRRELGAEAIKVVDKSPVDGVDDAPPLPGQQPGTPQDPPHPEATRDLGVTTEGNAAKIEALQNVLLHLALPPDTAYAYARAVYAGASLVIVPMATERQDVAALLQEYGATNL